MVFLFFFISGITFYLILRKIVKNRNFCYFSTLIYFFYPYLLGQSFFNSKDVPFMTVWLICSYLSFNIIEKLNKKSYNKFKYYYPRSFNCLFALNTSYWYSNPVSIFYNFLLLIGSRNINFYDFFKTYYYNLIQFYYQFYFLHIFLIQFIGPIH